MNRNTNITNTLKLDRKASRRGFLRGAGIGAAGVAALTAVGVGETTASAAPGTPPISVTAWGARHGLTMLTERVSGASSLVSDRWRVTGHLWVKNHAVTTTTVYKIRVGYIGNNAPSATEVEFEFDPIYIGPGDTKIIEVPDGRLHYYSMPAVMQVKLWAYGKDSPHVHEVFLNEYNHVNQDGAYYFPGKTSDLPDGQYWATGGNHGYNSNHGGSLTQRFAYDVHVRRWTGSSWSTIKAGGDSGKKEDHLIWGTPVYAPATGYIIHAAREKLDYEPGDPTGTAGGNHYWIQTEGGDAETGGFWLIAHLKRFSPPAELVPVEDGPGPLVYRGQYLGQVGNSGNSSGPHLHFHYQRGISKYLPGAQSSYGEGRPLKFRNLRVRQFFANGTHWNPDVAHQYWNEVSPYAGIGENTLVDTDGPPPVASFVPKYTGADDITIGTRPGDTLAGGGTATIDPNFKVVK